MQIKTKFRCMSCNKECDHEIEMKVMEDSEGFWIASGPYGKEDANKVLGEAIKRIEEYNKVKGIA